MAERKRRVEREKVKEGLRVWLERKAGEIKKRKIRDGGVSVLVWRFSKRLKGEERWRGKNEGVVLEGGEGRVRGLKKFWEGVGGGVAAGA